MTEDTFKYPTLTIGKYTFDIPIIQGGMGVGVSWDQLAGTVSKYDALGVISTVGTGYYKYPKYINSDKRLRPNPEECNSKEALVEIFSEARKICGDKPLAVNIMHALSGYKQNVIDSCDAGADIIICGAGLALDLPELTKNYPDVALVPIVSSSKALNVFIKKWAKHGRLPDAVVVEGPLSGGHQGFKNIEACFLEENKLENIVSDVLIIAKEYNIPVIAAGGIWDKIDIEKFLSLGCSGVQMGTRFVATTECDTSSTHKEYLIKCTEEDITLKASPVGFPSRSITTNIHKLIKKGEEPKVICSSNCVFPCNHGEKAKQVKYCIADRLGDCILSNLETGLFFTGSNGYKVNEIITVKELLDKLVLGE